MQFDQPFALLWLPFCLPWAPFGSPFPLFAPLLAPFATLLTPFGFLLVPFGALLPYFWFLGSLFGTLSLSFGGLWLPLASILIIKVEFSQFCSLFYNQFAEHPQKIEDNSTEEKFPLALSPAQAPGAGICRRQLKSTLWPPFSAKKATNA